MRLRLKPANAPARGASPMTRTWKPVSVERITKADDDDRDDDEDDADPHIRAEQSRQDLAVVEGAAVGEIVPLRIAPWPARQIVEQELRDVDEHQAGQDLVGAEPRSSSSAGIAA